MITVKANSAIPIGFVANNKRNAVNAVLKFLIAEIIVVNDRIIILGRDVKNEMNERPNPKMPLNISLLFVTRDIQQYKK